MNFINFGQWGLVFITYFGTSQNDLFFAELAMQLRYIDPPSILNCVDYWV